jgi:capsular exopolysaccharide synthesis family protein
MGRIDEALRQAGMKATPDPATAPPALEAFPTASDEKTEAPRPIRTVETQAPPRIKPEEALDVRSSGDAVSTGRPYRFPVVEKLVIHNATAPGTVEQYRRIAATLHHLQEERALKVLMIASAQVGEGKTLTAANLALTLSESYRRRVLLIDADLRRPSLSALFRIQRAAGLSESLQAPVTGPLRVFELSQWLSLLPAGKPSSDPMAGLTSGRMQKIIAQAADTYDWVILDTPPVALQPDAHLLSAMVEGTVFVIGAGISQSPVVQQSIETIGADKILGIVLNRVDPNTTNENAYYEYYYDQQVPEADNGSTSRGVSGVPLRL